VLALHLRRLRNSVLRCRQTGLISKIIVKISCLWIVNKKEDIAAKLDKLQVSYRE